MKDTMLKKQQLIYLQPAYSNFLTDVRRFKNLGFLIDQQVVGQKNNITLLKRS